jgi:hypothetical protein
LIVIPPTLRYNNNANRVLRDDQVYGGQSCRSVDRFLSENLGGYGVSKMGEIICIWEIRRANIHAAEHTARGFIYNSDKEFA